MKNSDHLFPETDAWVMELSHLRRNFSAKAMPPQKFLSDADREYFKFSQLELD